MVTAFWPSMTTGPGKTDVHVAGATRFVVDCRVYPVYSNPATLVGHVKITYAPEGVIDSCGLNERLNTTPEPELPPYDAVP